MARDAITPVATTDGSTSPANFLSATNLVSVTSANGAYIKTSAIDATRLIFVAEMTSSKCSSAAKIIVRSGSTAGNDDFEPGIYSTLRNKIVTIPKITTGLKTSSAYRRKSVFVLGETARYLDTDGYLKFDFTNTSAGAGVTSVGLKFGAILVGK